ncbi:hypothetical protein LJB87_00170 [Alistipes sp. OttesenSCG-928-L06]|nr:hypothetical protein [Alistipes sp. OttesenSCG-928-L06]
MKFEIIEIEELSGDKGKIYSVSLNDEDQTLFDKFVEIHDEQFPAEIDEITNRLHGMGNNIGHRYDFFKHDEGIPGDGVCALYDIPERSLRLYCIRYGCVAIVLGGGGKKNVRAWQDDSTLAENAQLMINISRKISERMEEGDLKLTDDGLVGNLIWEEENEYDE